MYALAEWTIAQWDRFDQMLMWLNILEGRISHNENDWGGLTMRGVTQVVYDDFRLDMDLKTRSVEKISEHEIRMIYRIGYVSPGRIMQMERPLDFVRFQGAVNFGPTRDIKMLQFALGYEYYRSGMIKDPAKKYADGRIGPKTTKDIGCMYTGDMLCKLYLDQQAQRYEFIVSRSNQRKSNAEDGENIRDQRAFIVGWLRRIDKTASLVGLDYQISANVIDFAKIQNEVFRREAA